MKPVKSKSIIKKVRAKNGTDIYWTNSTWDTKEIDGVTFIAVSKDNTFTSGHFHWMRKDNMEYVK